MDINDVLYEQVKIAEEIKKVLVNFKKDGQARKTPDYIQRRLDTLDKLWADYRKNHDKLKDRLSMDDEYFGENYYERTRQEYLTVYQYIEKTSFSSTNENPSISHETKSWAEQSMEEAAEQPLLHENTDGNQDQDTSKIKADMGATKTSSGSNSKLDELLKKQLSNFKAFSRTVSNINVESMKEKWEFEDSLKTIQARWSAIDSLHWELDSDLEESNKHYELRFTEHEKKYYEIKRAINTKMWSVSHREKSTPQLDIPIFNGNYQQWTSFKDLFCEAIHNNPSLSNAHKMQFLKSKLKGEPERLIQHLQISSENYNDSWEILNHRYNNKKMIFNHHMDSLMNLPVMQQAHVNHIKRLHDVTTECLNAIKNLGINIVTWDPILVYILVQKLDSETYEDYQGRLKQPRELPTLKEFLKYLELKFTTMESGRRKQENYNKKSIPSSSRQERSYNYKQYSSNKAIAQSSYKNKLKCPICNSQEHGIYYCKQFLEMSPTQKRQAIMNLNFCFNCLHNHNGKQCTSSKRCRECNGCHNTIMHASCSKSNSTPNDMTSRNASNRIETAQPRSDRNYNTSNVAQQHDVPEVLLATAMIRVQGADGQHRIMRALVDQGSQVSLITAKAAQLLQVHKQKCRGVVTGVGTKDNVCTGMITIRCCSMTENFTFSTDAYIMKSLTRNLPNESFQKPAWELLQKISLADPEFNQSKPIDILLGADIYSIIIMDGIYKAGNMTPVAQQTRLGWILCGKIKTLQCNVTLNNIDEIQQFWEIEDISDTSSYSTEEHDCLNYYKTTTKRLQDGKYQVRLPLKSNIEELGESKHKAIAQFRQLEKKFKNNKEIEKHYKLFIAEYQELGHMKLADNSNMTRHCYLPHHCVLREDSVTTSHRVVFNASQNTSSGTSLNDCMFKGPNLQKDLLSLILGWRKYQVAFTADIEKMFRQISMHEDDQGLQKIVWRDSPADLLREYQLTTVTYGTKAAPFLAMMTLRQLASDERVNYPEAAQIVESSFYMDDLLHGAYTLESALSLKQDLIEIMKSGGFNLRKWNSNYQELLNDQPQDNQAQENYNFKLTESRKTLGLFWDPCQDVFIFQSKIMDSTKESTKRSLLSDISKLFDPLGWLTPLSTKMKLLFQRVWSVSLAWDDQLPHDINQEWQKVKDDITQINQMKVPRWLGSDTVCKIELHGFCDSSQKAYACVIYSKIIRSNQVEIKLIAGKSRLVPCNKNVSLPKLELSGALLLSKLMKKVKQAFSENQVLIVYGWTDSMAVLGWLQGSPDRWKPFVSNRVQKITEEMPPRCWQYVKSADNPADCASRGLTASQLREHPLWWHGPDWLNTRENLMQDKTTYTTNQEERQAPKQVNVMTKNSDNNLIKELIHKYSSFTKLVRVLSWVRRFITKNQHKENTTWLSLSELRETKKIIIKQVQGEEFAEEIHSLKEKNMIPIKSKLNRLNPFLDSDGILRVGGRLRNAHISWEMKNPIIISQNHRLTELIINKSHELTYHGGAQATLAFTRQKYWILSGVRTTKKYIQRCVTCKKQKASKQEQMMGDLPEARVNPSRPFKHTGVDFTGHVYLKANKGRGIKTTKGYVAVFICMVTKAVHLELVSDLSTSSFIAALRRMAARRGTPSDIYCDNGRNFVGASRVIQEEYREILTVVNEDVQRELADMEIKFHFNAPSWPSAGGIWEAAVKSFKFHLKRVIGHQKLTYEEYSTLLSGIESCLNSRPLMALTEDGDDFLTPSHFLSSGPVLTLVETETDLRTRWQLTQQIIKDIWKRWHTEYLSQLTARSKWTRAKNNLKINDVVLVHEDNLPPGKWIMGRVTDVHPGKDGLVRVVTLKTKTGYIKRPVIKLTLLISQEDETPNQSTQSTCDDPPPIQTRSRTTPRAKVNSKNSFFTSMLMTFLLFMTIISSSNANVNITRFRDNQSMFFDKVADMSLIKDEWKLIVYYQMTPYWQGNKALDTYINTLERTCKTMREQVHCNALIIQLRHGYEELEYYNQLLLSQQIDDRPASRQRLRRSLINGVGYLANSLLGVLDERFAEQYKADISLLQENQKHIVDLWRNQTSVVEAENNLLKRTENVMNQQHKIINKHMNVLENNMKQIEIIAQANSVVNDFAIGSIIASNVLSNLKNLQNTLMDTVADVYQGRFNLHLLTPEQLIDELSIIASKLTKDVSLPVDNIHSDLRKLYSLIKVKTRVMQEYLIFELRIPLVSRESYEILKIVPVPKNQGDKAIKLVPVSDYVGMNIKKDTFIPMSEIDVRGCFVQMETYFCHSQKPEYQMKGDKNLCQLKNNECETESSLCKNIWEDSYAINTYIYSCCEQCQIRTMCEDQMTAHQLTGSGLITLGHGCLIKTDIFTIYPHKPHTSEVRMSPNLYTPKISPINYIINISIPHLNISDKDHTELEQEASIVQNHIKDLKESKILLDSVSNHDVHHYAMIYVIIGVMLSAGIALAVRRIRQGCRRVHNRTPEATVAWRASQQAPPALTPAPPALTPAPRTRPAEDALRRVQPTTPQEEQTSSHVTRFENRSASPILRKFNEMLNESM